MLPSLATGMTASLEITEVGGAAERGGGAVAFGEILHDFDLGGLRPSFFFFKGSRVGDGAFLGMTKALGFSSCSSMLVVALLLGLVKALSLRSLSFVLIEDAPAVVEVLLPWSLKSFSLRSFSSGLIWAGAANPVDSTRFRFGAKTGSGFLVGSSGSGTRGC